MLKETCVLKETFVRSFVRSTYDVERRATPARASSLAERRGDFDAFRILDRRHLARVDRDVEVQIAFGGMKTLLHVADRIVVVELVSGQVDANLGGNQISR